MFCITLSDSESVIRRTGLVKDLLYKGNKMTSKYTAEDLPMILNNIGWQLKRIADLIEQENKKDSPPVELPNSKNFKMTELIKSLNKDD